MADIDPSRGAGAASSEHLAPAALKGLTVLERGWLSSNNILIHAAPGEPGAVLVDTGHVVHAEQTVALVRHALAAAPLARIVNTHLHSDHCGGNAALQRAFGAPITIPPGLADAVRAWDLERLGHDDFGQRERFHIEGTLAAGGRFVAGARCWDAIAAPGHDPHALMFFDARAGVLLSADALWGDGFGIVFPELVGEEGFEDVAATLDAIERLAPRVVVPGHGAPFTEVAAALARARSRLAAYRAEPLRHARHAVKVLLVYHLMEERAMAMGTLVQWAADAPIVHRAWRAFGERFADAAAPAADGPVLHDVSGAAGRDALRAWLRALVVELAAAGALEVTPEGQVHHR
jgi:glyoxylase-like metal-dependent hydrolase (beta-lactamase superfamily II)